MIHGIYLGLFFAFINGFMPHDVPLAIFTLSQNQDQIALTIKMEYEDANKVFQLEDSEFSTVIFEQLINTTSTLEFDGIPAKIQVQEVKMEGEHVRIIANINPTDYCQKIAITSTLLNSIPNHSNIIQLRLGQEDRDFRMHKSRTRIEIAL